MAEKLKRDLREHRDFTKVDLRAAGHILLSQGDEYTVIVEAEEHILPYLATAVENDTLILNVKKPDDWRRLSTHEMITYRITMPVVAALRISGGGKAEADTLTGQSFALDLPGGAKVQINRLEMDMLTINVPGGAKVLINEVKSASTNIQLPGSGNIDLPQLETERLTVNIQGAGNIRVQGTTIEQTINAFGVGNYKATLLNSKKATVHVPGLANATLWVEETLTVNLSGMGNVRYYGNPKLTSTVRGTGRIKHLGDAPVEVV